MAITQQESSPRSSGARTTATTATTAPEPVAAPESTEAVADPRPPLRDIKGVRYTGGADTRSLSVADLTTLGVSEPKTDSDLVWGSDNGKVIAMSELNAETVDALLGTGEFEVVTD